MTDDLNEGLKHIAVGEHSLNITETILTGSESDVVPDNGVYMCEVCTDHDTQPEECHTANVTIHVIGGPPFIDKVVDNGEPSLNA